MDIYYIDGQFVEEDKAFVSIKDIIVLRGYGIFDFFITYNRRPFHLKEHVERFENSAKYVGLELKHSNEEICKIVEETLKKNPHHNESSIRIVFTGGISADGVSPEGNGKLMIMVASRRVPPQWWYTEGAKIITVDSERFIPCAKSTNYLTAIYAGQKAKKENAIEAIYVDRNNRILEGTTSNVFFFKQNKLISPNHDMLPGITRSVILKLAGKSFEVETRDVMKSELGGMDEIFITASNKEVVPIINADDLQIGDGRIGKNTQRIMQLFKEYTTNYGLGK